MAKIRLKRLIAVGSVWAIIAVISFAATVVFLNMIVHSAFGEQMLHTEQDIITAITVLYAFSILSIYIGWTVRDLFKV